MKMFKRLFSLLALLTLSACGGGGSDAGTPGFGDGSGGGTTVTPTVTMELTLVDQTTGASVSNVLAGQPVKARAVLRRNGSVQPGEIVQFEIEQSGQLVKIDPVAGSILTSDGGVAEVTVTSLGNSSGAGRIKATAIVGSVTATASANFFATSGSTTPPTSLTLSPVSIGSTTVSAYGTTGVEVTVQQAGAAYTAGPVVVNFTTSCPAGKATITANATTRSDGVAVATFVDNGCAQTADSTVTVTASISSDTESASMTVRSPTTGSLRFVSVVPADKSITLRGQGGNGRQENATVTFQLVDVAGQGVGNADVCFDISTYIGGLNVDGFFPPDKLPATQGSNALCGDPDKDALSKVRYVKRTNPDGTVAVQINSGTVPTPVRVRARAIYPAIATLALESFSDTLSVSTGLPLQRSFSLAVDKANIDGGNFDGEVAVLTVRLADQFSNPVPDGTVVNFIASGAAVCTSNNGSCRTSNGVCSCNVVSQARRPPDNRIVVTAYAVGLEDFDDRDGDNAYTPTPYKDSDGIPTTETSCSAKGLLPTLKQDCFYDLGDAYVDANKTGDSSSVTINTDTDILIPYQDPAKFTKDGNGTRGTAHIRASTVIYLSQASSAGTPTVVLPLSELQQEINLFSGNSVGSPFLRLQPFCPQGTPVPQTGVTLYLDDGIGNPMAAGTNISATDSSANVAPASPRPNAVLAIGTRAPSTLVDLPNLPKDLTYIPVSRTLNGNFPTVHGITVRGVEDKCAGVGSFVVQVTSPRGGAAAAEVLVEGDKRGDGRRVIEVRYLESGLNIVANARGSNEAVVAGVSYVDAAGATAPTLETIKCGTGGTLDESELLPVCKYSSSGTKTITVETTGPATSRSVTVNVF